MTVSWIGVRRAFAAAVVSILLVAAPAAALTLDEIIDLSKAGVAEEVLVALIEVDGTAWALTAEEIIELTEAGVSERVILALVGSGADEGNRAAEEPWPAEESWPADETWRRQPVWPGEEPSLSEASPTPVDLTTQVAVVPAAPEAESDESFYPADTFVPYESAGPVFVEHYETVVPVPVFIGVPQKVHTRSDHRRRGRDRDDRSRRDGHHTKPRGDGDTDGDRDEAPASRQARWARDLHRADDDHATVGGPARRARDVNAARRERDQEDSESSSSASETRSSARASRSDRGS